MDWFNELYKIAEKRVNETPMVNMGCIVNINGTPVCTKCYGRGEYDIDFNGNSKTCNQCNGEGK
jgi:DnaJ-class molecular chaperone